MAKWLMKTEPTTYSFDELVEHGTDYWDGVRSHAAQAHMKAMAKGDEVLIYHSVKEKQVVGIAKVVKTAYPDPTDDTGKWIAVDIKATGRLVQTSHVGGLQSLEEIC